MRPERRTPRRRAAPRPAPAAVLRTAQRLAGFTLLESIVALAIFAAAGMALYGLFNTNLIALNRTADVSRQVAVVRTAMDYLSSIDPRQRGEGEVELGDIEVIWTSTLVEPVRQGQNVIGGRASFDIGLYDVEFVVHHEGRALGTWKVRVAGYEKVRGLRPGQLPF
ncbi:MAG: prepilin-type N-terminal cleavage/methylation domain-containing protein [Gammaproteobacteria bacterium]|nr:prepilin-type N-terminal cleavage/methylation domain-containing protein [Gammaproteobacteria bacterium]